MGYPAIPDRRMAYDADGTVIAQALQGNAVTNYLGSTALTNLQGIAYAGDGSALANSACSTWWFFPEQRVISGMYVLGGGNSAITSVTGSNDTTNGIDGTWETATMSGGYPSYVQADSWRAGIKSVSFTGPKAVLQVISSHNSGATLTIAHLYGHKGTGQTPDDLIFLDSDDGGAEFTADEDFGDRPLGTTVTRQFQVKNASATHTANTISLLCNDTDFAISTSSSGPWGTSISITSLAPGVSSATLYVKNTTPNPGSVLGPRFTRITATVASWS